MKQYILRLIDSAAVHLYRMKYFYLTVLVVVSAIAGVIYHIDTGKDYDTYQICPRYSGNRCELLSKSEWEQESVFGIGGTNRFYNKKDPRQIKVFQFSDTREIRLKDYEK